jgi:hypothetical protein
MRPKLLDLFVTNMIQEKLEEAEEEEYNILICGRDPETW